MASNLVLYKHLNLHSMAMARSVVSGQSVLLRLPLPCNRTLVRLFKNWSAVILTKTVSARSVRSQAKTILHKGKNVKWTGKTFLLRLLPNNSLRSLEVPPVLVERETVVAVTFIKCSIISSKLQIRLESSSVWDQAKGTTSKTWPSHQRQVTNWLRSKKKALARILTCHLKMASICKPVEFPRKNKLTLTWLAVHRRTVIQLLTRELTRIIEINHVKWEIRTL